MDQINKYQPPENPAKTSDSRYKEYSSKFGESSWELDALDPTILSSIIEEAILKYVNKDTFQAVEHLEKIHKKKILKIAKNYK